MCTILVKSALNALKMEFYNFFLLKEFNLVAKVHSGLDGRPEIPILKDSKCSTVTSKDNLITVYLGTI